MKMKIDLHTHSNMSDGHYSPDDLVHYARSREVNVLSITDHDSIDGVEEAIKVGNEIGVDVISGVELRVDWRGKSVDILGYLFDIEGEELIKILEKCKNYRYNRAKLILEKLNHADVRISLDSVLQYTSNGTIIRPHIAMAMVTAGYVPDNRAAFDEYLNKPEYSNLGNNFRVSVNDGIEAIHEANGVAIIAHPLLPGIPDYLDLNNFLPEAVNYGIDGLEAYYTGYSKELTDKFIEMAKSQGLIYTGGSDFHGGHQAPNCILGDLNVPEICVAMLYERQERLRDRRIIRNTQ
jgi:3',5'-nucleoside bisphosphate phosphatase